LKVASDKKFGQHFP